MIIRKKNLWLAWLQVCIDKGQILSLGRNNQPNKKIKRWWMTKNTKGLQQMFWGLHWIKIWKSANIPIMLWEKPTWNRKKCPMTDFARKSSSLFSSGKVLTGIRSAVSHTGLRTQTMLGDFSKNSGNNQKTKKQTNKETTQKLSPLTWGKGF